MRKLLLCGLLLAVMACGGGSHVTSGRVIDHRFRPAHSDLEPVTRYRTETRYECHTVSDYNNGKYTSHQQCGNEIVSVPYTDWVNVYYPDDYDLQLQACKPEGTKNDKGKLLTEDERCDEGWVDVTANEYQTYPIGSYYGGQP